MYDLVTASIEPHHRLGLWFLPRHSLDEALAGIGERCVMEASIGERHLYVLGRQLVLQDMTYVSVSADVFSENSTKLSDRRRQAAIAWRRLQASLLRRPVVLIWRSGSASLQADCRADFH